jgi:hypothetical protein
MAEGQTEVVWVEGSVSLKAPKGNERVGLPGDFVNEADLLTVKDESLLFLSTPKHGILELKGPKTLRGDQLLSGGITTYMRLPRIKPASIPGRWPSLEVTQSTLPRQETFAIVSPYDTATKNTSPWVEWKAPSSVLAVTLTLEMIQDQGGSLQIERWENVRTQRFRFSQPLRRGKFFRVTMEAKDSGFRAQSTSFYVLDEAELIRVQEQEVETTRKLEAALPLEPVGRILMAQWLDDHGLFEEASREWHSLHRDFPRIALFNNKLKQHNRRFLIIPSDFKALKRLREWLLELGEFVLLAR